MCMHNLLVSDSFIRLYTTLQNFYIYYFLYSFLPLIIVQGGI